MPITLKSGSLKLLEPSGPLKDCNGITLPFTSGSRITTAYFVVTELHIIPRTLPVACNHKPDLRLAFACRLVYFSLWRWRQLIGFQEQFSCNCCSIYSVLESVLRVRSASSVRQSARDADEHRRRHVHPELSASELRSEPGDLLPLLHTHVQCSQVRSNGWFRRPQCSPTPSAQSFLRRQYKVPSFFECWGWLLSSQGTATESVSKAGPPCRDSYIQVATKRRSSVR